MLEALEEEEVVGKLEALEMEELEMVEALDLVVEMEEEEEEALARLEVEVKALVNVEVTPTVPERLPTAPSGVTAGRRLATLTEAQDPRLTRTLGSVELTPTVQTGLRTVQSSASAEKPRSLGLVGPANSFSEIINIKENIIQLNPIFLFFHQYQLELT